MNFSSCLKFFSWWVPDQRACWAGWRVNMMPQTAGGSFHIREYGRMRPELGGYNRGRELRDEVRRVSFSVKLLSSPKIKFVQLVPTANLCWEWEHLTKKKAFWTHLQPLFQNSVHPPGQGWEWLSICFLLPGGLAAVSLRKCAPHGSKTENDYDS